MTPRIIPARERQRLDALIDRPLRTFRAEIERISDLDLERLQARLEARLVGAQFTRSAQGMARHLAGQELPLLERRLSLVSAERAKPQMRQLQLVELGDRPEAEIAFVTLRDESNERQAA